MKEEAKAGTWRSVKPTQEPSKPKRLEDILSDENFHRSVTSDGEFNRVLGGGIVPGSLVLIGGEPGIGKSTLMLQIAMQAGLGKILYVSGEESEYQIKMRAQRLNTTNPQCYLLAETAIQQVFRHAESLQPSLLIIDSIQTLQSSLIDAAAGSISQVRECTAELMRFAKETHTPVFLIGHITKEGSLAGPKVLEHMVDTVLQFEGDRHMNYRLLRASKNRFGPTSELGIYEMQNQGLREVTNPSEILLTQRENPLSGVAISCTMEGNRPLLIELQALVCPAAFGMPQRTSTGFDQKRLHMLLAVLERRGGKRMSTHDVFLNVAGGLRIDDPANDLAVCMAILSSLEEVYLPNHSCFAGEVGLGGEVRSVQRVESRIAEAQKLGFKTIYISSYNKKGLDLSAFTITIRAVGRLEEVYAELF